ncbi:GNAT family N-acetyltransferase [Marinilactibacillus psychrotolerans]|uniref:GNAT family N-acetyltransferase n=1 Tax=Marinilactibacillus psychrotolerans TaxID=191770 RepID=UPI00381DAC07
MELRITEEQEKYVTSIEHTIAQAYVDKSIIPFVIKAEEEVIGFIAYALDEEGDLNLLRFMIDSKLQKRGYGKQSLKLIIEKLTQSFSNEKVWLSIHPNNDVAKHLYESFGFQKEELGFETDDEIFMSLNLKESKILKLVGE